ncbi:hypothetical protein KCU78_g2045, partial [Aureobasidium melanogenum]
MPVQSLVDPRESSGAAVVAEAVIEGMLLVGTFLLPSVIVTTLEIPKVDSEAGGDRAIGKPDNDNPVVLELDDEVVNVEAAVREVAIPLVEAIAAEALKSQSLATNNSVWLLQQLGPVSTQQNATSLFSKTPAVDVQLYILPNRESMSSASTTTSFYHQKEQEEALAYTAYKTWDNQESSMLNLCKCLSWGFHLVRCLNAFGLGDRFFQLRSGGLGSQVHC